jgi:hypothetical protein
LPNPAQEVALSQGPEPHVTKQDGQSQGTIVGISQTQDPEPGTTRDDDKEALDPGITLDGDEREALKAVLKTGVWPFFQSDAEGGNKTLELDPSGKFLIITQSSKDRNQVYVIARKVYNVFDL